MLQLCPKSETTMQPTQIQEHEILAKLADASSVSDVLLALEPAMTAHDIKHLRYYRYSHSKQSLYSVDSVGHSAKVADFLKYTDFETRYDESPPELSETFWVRELECAVLFIRIENATHPLQLSTPTDGLPTVLIPPNQKREIIDDEKSGTWVDIPLWVGNTFAGKLSCDFTKKASETPPTELRRQVLRFQRLAQTVVPHLEFWRSQNVTAPLNWARDKLRQVNTIRDLYDFCVSEEGLRSPVFFDCDYVDILTFENDTENSRKLILRDTSFRSMLSNCDQLYYRFPHHNNTITGWVAKEGRTVRLDDMLDVENRKRQLSYYDKSIEWTQHIPLSRRHGSMMIARIPDPSDSTNAIGVLRLADKKANLQGMRNRSKFTARDQRLIELISEHCIGPKLQSLRHREFFEELPLRLQAIDKLSYAEDGVGPQEFYQKLVHVFLNLFPIALRSNNRKKKLLISRILPGKTVSRFQLLAIADSAQPMLIEDDEQTRIYDAKGTLTGYCIQKNSSKAILLTDLEAAEKDEKYRPITKGAQSVIICRIAYQEKVFGTVAVVSSHFDLNMEQHGRVIEVLAARTGEILARRCNANVNASFSGVRHDLGSVIESLEDCLFKLKNTPSDKRVIEQLDDLTETLHDLLDAHCRSGPLEPALFARQLRDTSIKPILCQIVNVLNSSDPQHCNVDLSTIDPNMNARVYQPFFRACVLNLIRNAVKHGDGSPISIECTFEDGLFVTIVQNRSKAGRRLIKDILQAIYDPLLDTPSQELEPRLQGLHNVKRLARWHQVSDELHGDLTLEEAGVDDEIVRLKLVLPIAVPMKDSP